MNAKANNTIDKVRELQRGLYQCAKNNRQRRFHALYDKVVQTAAKIVMDPIFEADFRDCSFGFRPKRNQHQALEVIRKKCNNKGWWVLDADIKGYFDNIDHEKLMKLVEKRICDRRMTKLIRLWLKAGVMEDGHVIETETGSAQGASISPLLSNI